MFSIRNGTEIIILTMFSVRNGTEIIILILFLVRNNTELAEKSLVSGGKPGFKTVYLLNKIIR